MARLRPSWVGAVLLLLLPHLAALDSSQHADVAAAVAAAYFATPYNNLSAATAAAAVAAAAEPVPWSYSNPAQACVQLPATLCLSNANGTRSVVLTAGPKMPALAASWTFDDGAPLDVSGNSRHIAHAVASGPGRRGAGQSAFFPPGSYATIAAKPGDADDPLNGAHFTLSFWMFLIDDEDAVVTAGRGGSGGSSSSGANGFAPADDVEAWRTVLRKGGSKLSSSPGLFLWPRSRRLRVKYQTRSGSAGAVDSQGNLPARRWHHVALVLDGRLVQLYVNGILDAEVVNTDGVVTNSDPLCVVVGVRPCFALAARVFCFLRVFAFFCRLLCGLMWWMVDGGWNARLHSPPAAAIASLFFLSRHERMNE